MSEQKDLLLVKSRDLITQITGELEKVVEENELLKKDNLDLLEKNKTYNQIADYGTYMDFSQVAKELAYEGIGRNKLLAFLRGLNVLRSNNEPYQSYVDKGYFKVVVKENLNLQTAHTVTLASIEGINFIRRLLDERD